MRSTERSWSPARPAIPRTARVRVAARISHPTVPAAGLGSSCGTACSIEGTTLVAGVASSASGGLLLVCDDLVDLDCGESYLYCVGATNSTGNGADIFASLDSPGLGQMTLYAQQAPPGNYGLFFTGQVETQVPFGDGYLCIVGGAGLTRLYPVALIDAGGRASVVVDLEPPPVAGLFEAFSTWKFQFWFRDPLGPGGSGFNTSDALSLTFCPLSLLPGLAPSRY